MKKGIEQVKKTAKEINLEMAGMSNLYTLNQDKVKIRLQITKHIETKTLHECTDYKELFVDTLDQSPRKRMRLQYHGRKILVKGRIGMGKSVLAKKIVLDWSKGAFAAFPLVFRVDLNLAQPDDTIESIIQRLSNGVVLELEKLKSNILVIIDGFDGRKLPENVLRFVEDRGRNILVTTSDYHLAELIEGHFDTVATLQGFSKEDAQEFLASLDAGPNVQTVLSVKVSLPSVLESSDGINPMVTTLLAVLVKYNKLEPETKTISFCEVCYTLLQLLYSSSPAAAHNDDDGNKAKEEESLDDANKAKEEESLMSFAKKMGKLALDSFQLGKLPNESNSVYDWLMRKGTNGFMSFTNRWAEVFLAALYFVFEGDASGVIFDPLFMNFCLTLLSEQKFISVPQKETTRDKMKQYVKEEIDLVQLDLHDVVSKYPACDISHLKDELVLQFLLDVVKSCEQTQDLILVPGLPVGKILNAVNITSPTFKAILLVEKDHIVLDKVMKNIEPEILSIVIDNQVGKPLDELFHFLDTVERDFSIHYIGGDKSTPMIDFALFAKSKLNHLCIYKKDRQPCHLVARQALPEFPSLQSLEVASHEVNLGCRMIQALVNALGQNHFPKLNFCSLNRGFSTELSPLFQADWTSLKRLRLREGSLNKDALENVCSKILPNLVWLEIGQTLHMDQSPVEDTERKATETNLRHLRILRECAHVGEYFSQCKEKQFQKLRALELECSGISQEFLDILTKEIPELSELVFQGLSSGGLPKEFARNEVVTKLTRLELIKCCLSNVSIFSENHGFTNLEKLTLVDCGLYPNDIRYLAQANVDGLLPKLKYLNLSDNKTSDGCKHLFEFNSRWENMLCLNIERTDEQSYGVFDDFLHLTQKSLSGCLGLLEELIVTTENPDYVPKIKRQCWSRLKSIKISSHTLSWKQVLSPLADLVDRGGDEVLPSLEVVTFCLPARKPPILALERQLLRRNGVRVYFTTRDQY